MAPGLTYTGVEVSLTMVREARKANRALEEEGRVKFYLTAVDRLPFPDATFDRAVSVNSIYFWQDQLSGLTRNPQGASQGWKSGPCINDSGNIRQITRRTASNGSD